MLDSKLRSYNLQGVNLDLEVDAVANPSPRLIAVAGSTPLRVLVEGLPSSGTILLAYDQAVYRNLSSGLIPSTDVFQLFAGSLVNVLAPGQKLYAASNDGAPLVNVATSDSVPISDVLAQAYRATGTPSRLFRVDIPTDFNTGETPQRVRNDPPTICTAPAWSPLRVTVFLPDNVVGFFPQIQLSDDQDLLRQNNGDAAYIMNRGTERTFILAPNQSIYAIATSAAFVLFPSIVTVSVSTTLFTDVFNTTKPAPLSRTAQERVLWNNLWQGSDGVCF